MMNYQKGFSLLEVLISLMFVATVIFILVEQQIQTKNNLIQMMHRVDASHYLDQIDEHLLFEMTHIPTPSPPYRFELIHTDDTLLLQLKWTDNLSMTRHYG